MPIYEYRCPNGHTFEVFQRMSDPPASSCEVCGAGPVEKVWKHLHLECRAYVPGAPRFRPKADLEAKVRAANEMKLRTSMGTVDALQTKVARLEEKHQWAVNLEKGVKIAASRRIRSAGSSSIPSREERSLCRLRARPRPTFEVSSPSWVARSIAARYSVS